MATTAGDSCPQPICDFLEWDSQFFGLRIGRLNPKRITSQLLSAALEWVQAQAIDCLYFLAAAEDPQTIALAEAAGFRLKDIRITLEHSLRAVAPPVADASEQIRAARPEDIPALRSIARVSHRIGRFYGDPRFPECRCEELYETWIEKSCCGYADVVLVAEQNGQPLGYVSCHLSPERRGSIGLIAVDSKVRGRGIGERLVQASLRHFREKGMDRAAVVTQGSNIASQRLYQASRFRTQSVELWYHLWFDR
jgi:dTDP-4-amino-4,6-dideoxy-D-galactose acyltransferase